MDIDPAQESITCKFPKAKGYTKVGEAPITEGKDERRIAPPPFQKKGYYLNACIQNIKIGLINALKK